MGSFSSFALLTSVSYFCQSKRVSRFCSIIVLMFFIFFLSFYQPVYFILWNSFLLKTYAFRSEAFLSYICVPHKTTQFYVIWMIQLTFYLHFKWLCRLDFVSVLYWQQSHHVANMFWFCVLAFCVSCVAVIRVIVHSSLQAQQIAE